MDPKGVALHKCWEIPNPQTISLQGHATPTGVSGGIDAAAYSGARSHLTTISFAGLDREFVAGEAHGFGNDIPRAELRLRKTGEYQPDNR